MVKSILYVISLLISTLNSKLIIHSPESLAALFPPSENSNKDAWGVIPASYANFGFVPYGHAMVSLDFLNPNQTLLFIRWEDSSLIRSLTPFASQSLNKSSRLRILLSTTCSLCHS